MDNKFELINNLIYVHDCSLKIFNSRYERGCNIILGYNHLIEGIEELLTGGDMDWHYCSNKLVEHDNLPIVLVFHEPKKLKKPSRILVVSMGDLFGEFIPDKWINKVLEVVKKCPQHTFLFLTKNPNRYYSFKFPDNTWIGASVVNRPDEEVISMGKSFIVTNAHTIADTMSFFDRSLLDRYG